MNKQAAAAAAAAGGSTVISEYYTAEGAQQLLHQAEVHHLGDNTSPTYFNQGQQEEALLVVAAETASRGARPLNTPSPTSSTLAYIDEQNLSPPTHILYIIPATSNQASGRGIKIVLTLFTSSFQKYATTSRGKDLNDIIESKEEADKREEQKKAKNNKKDWKKDYVKNEKRHRHRHRQRHSD